jgi:hypothetical protein
MFSALLQSKSEQAAKVYKTTQFSSVAAAAVAARRRRMKEIA